MNDISEPKPIGFWGVWGLTVGTMIGSGIFLLPSVLAPYGFFALAGWMVTTIGAVCLALVIGRLAANSPRSGGPAIYVKDALGDLAGFLTGWSLWISYVIAVPAVAMAFAGYAGSLFPMLSSDRPAQVGVAALLILFMTMITVRGSRDVTFANTALTLLKILPLLIVVCLAFVRWDMASPVVVTMPEDGWLPGLAAIALLTMWAFLGLEAGLVAADDVANPRATMPKAVIAGVLTVAIIYMLVTLATMMLVPMETLAQSEAPLVEATRSLGQAGVVLVATGAMISTAGSLLALLFVIGHMASGMAQDGLAPKRVARRDETGSPVTALIIGTVIGIVLLGFNLTEGLLGAFTFLLMMSTATALVPYLLCAVAGLKQSWRSFNGWTTLGLVSIIYSFFALVGSGLNLLLWGFVLILMGLPVYAIISARAAKTEDH